MKRIFLFTIISLLCSWAEGQEHRPGVVAFSVNYMREAPDYEKGLENQALMGTIVEILGREGYWLKIRTPEPYTAWVNEMGVVPMSETELAAYLKAEKYICTVDISRIYSRPSEDSQRISELVLGDILRVWEEDGKPVKKRKFLGVMLPTDKTGYVRKGDLADFAEWAEQSEATPDNIVSTAMRFLGVPYMWGGTSPKGMDCSGLVRTAFLANGVLLPRNASQQVKVGDPVDVSFVLNGDFSALQKGDLLFFGNRETGKVTHVAIYIGDGHFIHSSQLVRINSLRESDDDYYNNTPRLLYARRLCGLEDQGKGIVSVKASPYYFVRE